MIETHEYRGHWWLPRDESKKLSGTLTVTRGSATLDVLGDFGYELLDSSEDTKVYSPFPASQLRILGLTTEGKRVTLETCAVGPSSIHSHGIPTTTYRSRIALLGVWIAEGEEVSFDEIAIRLSELDTWTCVSGFSGSISVDEQPDTGRAIPTAFDIHFEPPPSVAIPLDGGDEARIDFGYSAPGWVGMGTTKVNFSQRASFVLRYAKPRNLEEVFTSASQARNFFSLAVGRPLTVLSVSGLRNDLLESDSQTRQSVELFWEIPYNPEPALRPRQPVEMLFTLPEVKPIISDLMRAWLSRYELLGPVFNLYFGMLYQRDGYIDVRFLSYAQAIETYDSRRRSANDLPEEEHKRLVTAVLDATSDPQHRKWLRERISHNRPTLRKRMRAVLEECPEVRNKVIGPSEKDVEEFISLFVASRNYYTHYSASGERRAAKGTALLVLVYQLRAIIEMSLLREIGFETQAIDEMFDRVQRYAEIRKLQSNVAEEKQSAGT